MSNTLRLLLLTLAVSTFSGCAKPVFTVVKPKVSEAAEGKALVFFMRPRRFEMFTGGGNQHAVIYDGDKYVGQLPAKYQLAYQAKPGKHNFMVMGGSADFLDANLKAGKKYYIVIEPRPGFTGLSFSMRPQNGQIDQEKLDAWHKVMPQVEPNELGHSTAEKNEARRKKLKDDKYTQWLQKEDRPTLKAAAGL